MLLLCTEHPILVGTWYALELVPQTGGTYRYTIRVCYCQRLQTAPKEAGRNTPTRRAGRMERGEILGEREVQSLL